MTRALHVSDGIHLGFEVGTGAPVSLPVRHLAVTGQTQESGKTTALEALVARAGLPALAFVTKRGEGSFTTGRRVAAYFRDRADWQFVDQLLEAQLHEKNKFLRPWIIRICRTTRTLADVQREVKRALGKAKGIHEGVYTQLDAYLDLIVPEIARARLATSLTLGPGLNVMDVSGYPTPMQMLFVQSAIDWINQHEQGVVTIIPEAWEFIPEGKGSPVKASAVALVRKGAGLRNYIWVDSQDMAGVDKTILRGCAVWLIGVQREANEIKRNLANIPAELSRPTPGAVAQLERGQFFVCFGREVRKVYVQPAWMDAGTAEDVARGRRAVPAAPTTPSETRTYGAIDDFIDEFAQRGRRAQAAVDALLPPKEDAVTKQEADELRRENEDLRRQLRELQRQLGLNKGRQPRGPIAPSVRPTPPAGARPGSYTETGLTEEMYQAFRARLLEEPMVLVVTTARPELRVEVERREITADGASLKGRTAKLLAGGWFDTGKTNSATRRELARTGSDCNNAALANVLNELVTWGFLTREGADNFLAVPGMKVNVVERVGGPRG